MNRNESIADFRISSLVNTVRILENALHSDNPRAVVLAQEALKELRLQTTTSEIYTETPLAEQIRSALIPDRIQTALLDLAPKPITTVFRCTNSDGEHTYVTIEDLTDHATLEEIVDKMMEKLNTKWLVEIERPEANTPISKELYSYRFCDVHELSRQAVLTFRITSQDSVGR